MNNADKIIKRCRALALAGMIGITSLGSSLPAFAAGPGDDSSRVSEISTGGPGDPGNTNSSNSTTNTGNSNNSNSNNKFQYIIQQYYHKYQCLEKGKRYVPDVRWKRDPECAPSWY